MPRLTPEQRAVRLTGVGASESAAISGLDPYRGAVDVWMRKPVGGRPPLVNEEDREESDQASVGHTLEPALRTLYTERTGIEVVPGNETLRHHALPSVLASPDGLGVKEDLGLEIKVVGWRMAHHWTEESLPDYVLTQAVQNMAVTGRARWDVLALVGGSTPRIYSVERDLDLELSLVQAVDEFWQVNVVGDQLPPIQSTEERKRYLLTRYPGSAKTACRQVADADGSIAEVIRWREAIGERIGALKEFSDEITNWLCEQVADSYGIEGPFGKFLWFKVNGQVDWRAVAEEMAGGAIPADLIEKHRRASFRSPHYYPPPKRRPTASKRRLSP